MAALLSRRRPVQRHSLIGKPTEPSTAQFGEKPRKPHSRAKISIPRPWLLTHECLEPHKYLAWDPERFARKKSQKVVSIRRRSRASRLEEIKDLLAGLEPEGATTGNDQDAK